MPLLVNRELWLSDDVYHFVPFSEYLELSEAEQLLVDAVQVNGDAPLEQLLHLADRFEAIAVEFPVLRDGRGFSFARELRVSGFTGQIRAIGETSRDKLALLERCGFDAVELAADKFKREYLSAYTEMSVRYQGAVDDPRPIYRQEEPA
jgi:uncharacterized protein (DUF934 family)